MFMLALSMLLAPAVEHSTHTRNGYVSITASRAQYNDVDDDTWTIGPAHRLHFHATFLRSLYFNAVTPPPLGLRPYIYLCRLSLPII